MRSTLVTLLLGLVVACAGSGPVLRSDVNPEADFARYRSFSFFEPLGTDPEGFEGYQSLLTQRLRRAVRIELESRGYRYLNRGGDLFVNFFLNLEKREDLRTIPAVGPTVGAFGYYGYRTGRYRNWPTHYETRVVRYTEGTLSIDLIDAGERLLVWNGTAEGSLRELNLRDTSDPAVSAAVAKIFALYPYWAGPAPVYEMAPPEEEEVSPEVESP